MKFGVVVEIRDVDEKSDVSSALTTRSIARHGGQIVMWGGAAYPDMIENFERALIIQFPRADAARHWYKTGDNASAGSTQRENLNIRVTLIS
ncbi:DUF1330 domain-containing protein [Paraburkholderia sp. RAU2J]|uniref:DUF1330 domain-containing protein n=1 Tax=unclassified Paraburkholderia TaxID=2615204 RepID=UPI000EB145D4|nr:DUF1330 domain-containing protein [Paraburkholderia sp. RAU2J]